VGNGEFAFTADPTGLQTFPQLYADKLPLSTQSQWGWHSFPGRPSGPLRMDTPKNTWRASGHNWQRANLPVYLPGNGALLAATAHMARLGAFPGVWRACGAGLPSGSIYWACAPDPAQFLLAAAPKPVFGL
jgi:hypothetical protein